MNVLNRVDGLWRRLSFRLLPGCCVQCGSASRRACDLCTDCESELPWNRSCCQRCALPLAHAAVLCGRCLKSAPEFDRALCPFRYEWPLDALITRFKFAADLAAGRVLAGLMAEDINARLVQSLLPRPQRLMPVPLHAERLRERGFNQVVELIRPLSRALGIPADASCLRRARATPQQTGLTALHRRRNVRGAFAVVGDVRGCDIALIDDVITTAATVRECAKVLKQSGAASVQVWAIARAGVIR